MHGKLSLKIIFLPSKKKNENEINSIIHKINKIRKRKNNIKKKKICHNYSDLLKIVCT